ncbi:MAG: polysaccharide deacetylase family protein [Sedimentisphaerales bacterium]|nr:polysaccharide deacetylase family protein [Sedimentisphaerales bacterium]
MNLNGERSKLKTLALRIDDIGASSKQFEVYSKKFKGLGNIFFFKYLPWFRAWGPYREMTASEWDKVFDILQEFKAKLTVAVTACWVEKDCTLTPFHEKFEDQAKALKKALKAGLIEIANHGLTHCVVGQHLPGLILSNRKFHREFWPWLPEKLHFQHVEQSQKILQDYFDTSIKTFVPPGNVFADTTIEAAKKFGIEIINCQTQNNSKNGIRILSNEKIKAFHDRELVLEGVNWLRKLLSEQPNTKYCFVKDI